MMKSLLTPFTLLFMVMFSSSSFAEWSKVIDNDDGDTSYVDFERIRKHGGYVYYWTMSDYLKPTQFGDLSSKVYYQGDCKLFRNMGLRYYFYKEPMGRGQVIDSSNNSEWEYPPPNSALERVLKLVCGLTK